MRKKRGPYKKHKERELPPFLYEIGDFVTVANADYLIKDRRIEMKKFSCKDGRTGFRQKQYLCECPKCHNSLWKPQAYLKEYGKDGNSQLSGIGCKYCTGKKVKVGFNDVGTTHPWIKDLLVDPKDAETVTAASRKKFWFKCPICGTLKYTGMVYIIEAGRVTCNKCSDNISYPNKFAYSVLIQANVNNLESEYRPSWAKHYRYDFSFYVRDKHYLLEMDGEQHHKECGWRKLEVQQQHDQEKDELAKENNCILIRINCEYGKEKYIKSEMEKSPLNNLIDFSKIDWKQVRLECCTNQLKKVCDFYNKHPDMSPSQISKYFHRCSCTIRTYLKRGTKLGLCSYKTTFEIAKEHEEQIFSTKNEHPDWTFQEIADEIGGITGGCVQSCLTRAKKRGDSRVDTRNSVEIKTEQKKQEIYKILEQHPEKSNYKISQETGYYRDLVKECREEMKLWAG